ncbi:MAG TPA: DUF4431 domain-containing protein [Pyrinomonadaceae bacterium]|nr:DUF4431 domain-containing protein [Pyrinomonadaceae bacterium]
MKITSNKFIFSAIFTFIFIIAGSGNAFAQNAASKKCLFYEPATVSLDGKLTRKVVVNASEQKETIWILKLNEIVCVAADENNEFNPAVEKVSDVQLVLNSKQFRVIRDLQNQKVSVTGTLFAAHTQHHFTDVLLIVTKFRKK